MTYRKNMRKTLKKTKKFRNKYTYNRKRNNKKNFTKRNFKYTKKLRGGATKTNKVIWGKILIIKNAVIDKSLLDKLPGDNAIYSNGVIIYNDEISLYISIYDIVLLHKEQYGSFYHINLELNNLSSILYNTKHRLMKKYMAHDHLLENRIMNLDISIPVKNKLFKQLEKNNFKEYELYDFSINKILDKVLIKITFISRLIRDNCFFQIKQSMIELTPPQTRGEAGQEAVRQRGTPIGRKLVDRELESALRRKPLGMQTPLYTPKLQYQLPPSAIERKRALAELEEKLKRDLEAEEVATVSSSGANP